MDQLNFRPDEVAGGVGTVDAPASEPIREMKLVGAAADVAAGVSVAAAAAAVVAGESGPVKRKRGRPRGPAKAPPAKKVKEDEDEDVCFICFDGGSLVLCDRRGCPKAYHPACIKRDEAFFQSAAKWNCGWHICSMCQKTSHHMCYTCTYSLCKGCIKKADYVSVRGDKGFCTLCMKTIMLIENNGQGTEEMAQVDFDDKTSWEYLFKVYWVYLKEKLSLTVDELTRAKNPWKGAGTTGCERISPDVRNGAIDLKSLPNGANYLKSLQNGTNDLKTLQYGASALESLTLDMSPETLEANITKRRKTDEQLNLLHEATLIVEKPGGGSGIPLVGSKEWATRELLEFVAHMRNGDTSPLSQLDVQDLMSEYIKKNNLQDPRLESQVLCDSRLYNLFGKPRVGHFEMLKLLENHFLVKEDSHKNIVGAVARQVDPDWNNDGRLILDKDNKHKPHQKGEERAPHSNLDEYAAIDVHNINLIYLRCGLIENLLEDSEKFHLKVVGSIVRIRIASSDQKQDMYRLVQVVGTSKVDQPYKLGNRTTDVVLEVLNLNKKETVSADSVSNEEFSEDECRHLRQSIRCGLVKQFTVGEILEKAVALQSVRLNGWLETEIQRLNHLLDRASEKGRKKELREIVEKLQLLKTPEERHRRLSEIPEVHADPKMNPECVSEEDAAELNSNKRGEYMKTRSSGSRGKGAKSSSPQKRSDGSNETSASTLTMGNTLSATEGEADELWHYQDPNGRVQGPFSLVQLQKWSTTGYFPTDMRIWASRQEDSVLLTDALKGEFHKALQFNNASLQSDVGGASDSKSYENQIDGTHVRSPLPSSTLCVSNVGNIENQSDSQSLSGQSSVQNQSALPLILGTNNSNSNPSAASSVTKSTYVIEMNGTAVLSNLHNQTLKVSTDNREGQVAQKEGNNVPSVLPVQDSPKTGNNADIVLNNREKQSVPSKLAVQDSVPSWSTASNLVAGGGAHLTEIADEWGRYHPTPAKFSAGEWGPGLSSKLPEAAGDRVVDTSKSNIEQLIHSSPSQRASTMSWQAIASEPIEFNTLAEESVSDLLAEVDAMESSQYGLPSPTSKRNFVDELFYGSIEEFSPIPDQGARSDGFSSSGDMHLPCQSATPEELVGPSHRNVFDLNNVQIPKSEVTVSWNNNMTIQHGGADGQTVPEPATRVEVERKIKSSDAPTAIQHGRSGTATPECTINAVEEGEIKSIDLPVEQKKRTEFIRPAEPLAINSDRAKVRNKTSIQQRGGDRTFKESATKVEEEEGEIKSTNISQPIRSAAQPLTLQVDQSNTQRAGSGFGRHSHGNTNAAGSRGSVGAAGSPRRYSGDRYNGSPRDRAHNQSRGPWSRQSYSGAGGAGGGSGGGGGGGYSRPSPKGPSPKGPKVRVCKFYESGRCKKGALCDYLHP